MCVTEDAHKWASNTFEKAGGSSVGGVCICRMKPHNTLVEEREDNKKKKAFFLLNTTHTNQRASLTSRGPSGIVCTSGWTVLHGPCSSRLMIILQFELHKNRLTWYKRDFKDYHIFYTNAHTKRSDSFIIECVHLLVIFFRWRVLRSILFRRPLLTAAALQAGTAGKDNAENTNANTNGRWLISPCWNYESLGRKCMNFDDWFINCCRPTRRL